jgi:hypothetical protein
VARVAHGDLDAVPDGIALLECGLGSGNGSQRLEDEAQAQGTVTAYLVQIHISSICSVQKSMVFSN